VLTIAVLAVAAFAVLPGSAGARSVNGARGLGTTVETFYSSTPHCPAVPKIGVHAYCYRLDLTKHGRVAALHVVIKTRPPTSARKRLALVIAMVPRPMQATNLNSNSCTVVRSVTLGRLIGLRYAAATTTRSIKTTASLRAERSPHC